MVNRDRSRYQLMSIRRGTGQPRGPGGSIVRGDEQTRFSVNDQASSLPRLATNTARFSFPDVSIYLQLGFPGGPRLGGEGPCE